MLLNYKAQSFSIIFQITNFNTPECSSSKLSVYNNHIEMVSALETKNEVPQFAMKHNLQPVVVMHRINDKVGFDLEKTVKVRFLVLNNF